MQDEGFAFLTVRSDPRRRSRVFEALALHLRPSWTISSDADRADKLFSSGQHRSGAVESLPELWVRWIGWKWFL